MQTKNKKPVRDASRDFSIIDRFKFGYRNREDQTNLPPGVLVPGSQNVLTNVSERIQCRKGYELDGPTSAIITPIASAYTFESNLGFERNLRTYWADPDSATSGKVEYRYVDEDGTVTWRTLLSSLTSVDCNFTTWWDVNEVLKEVLMVNGTANIWEWGGGVTTIDSVTATTITTEGTETWAQLGFYSNNTSHATRKITIGGVDYTYTGGETTTTLTGVTPSPVGPVSAGDIAHQTPVVTTNASMTDLSLARNDLIGTFFQQLFVGSLQDQTIYLSNFQDYKDYTLSSINESGFGYQFALDAPPVAFIALENAFTISAGLNQWYQLSVTTGTYTDNTNPDAPVVYNVDNWAVDRLKTNSNAAAQSQYLTSAMKNDVIFISQEPTLDRLGRVENIFGSNQTTNISDPIKLDFDEYDFESGQVFYNKYFIYVSIPESSIVRIYNIVKSYWEAPQTLPISKFYTVDGELYGHSNQTPESYKLFTGRADRVSSDSPLGNPIACNVVFSYQHYGAPYDSKNFNEYYIEGYISSNTTLTAGITYDINGCATETSYDIEGTDEEVVCLTDASGSLGKVSLGKHTLGDGNVISSPDDLPPKFRVIKTFARTDFFEVQFSFESYQTGTQWEILRFGPAVSRSVSLPTNITQ